MNKALKYLFILLLLSAPAMAVEDLYANDGTYLGNTSSNQYDPNSINNPYGKYGNPYSSNSIKNRYGQYGSEYSSTSPNNQYAKPGKAIPQNSGYGRPFGGWND